jgi:hypothetical protein
MPDDHSSDDIFRHLVKLMEELAGELGSDKAPPFIGYTIISSPGEPPRVMRMTRPGPCEIPYELVEGPHHFFISLEMPADLTTEPQVNFDRRSVVIQLDGREVVVDLPAVIDIRQCSWEVRHGLLDIVCPKA